MAQPILMLALSPTMETGTIAAWIKKEGDEISSGDVLCEVETDKATMEYESVQEGTLLAIIVPEGGSASVEQAIGIVGDPGEDIAALRKEIEATAQEAASSEIDSETAVSDRASSQPSETQVAQSSPTRPDRSVPQSQEQHGRVKASPLAKRVATERGVDLHRIEGSGPAGRVIKRDVEEASSSAGGTIGGAADHVFLTDESIPVSAKRRIIAQRLSESKFAAPHFYLKAPVATETMMSARKQLNASTGSKVSVNAFLLKFCAESIKRNPAINSSWQGDTIRQFRSIDIGLAVAQEDGLITPIVRNCGGKGIIEIDLELSDLIDRARTNKLKPEEYTGATFSISSLGTFGIEEFTAIINPPGSAILAVGQMQKVPVVDTNDQIVVRQQMKLTLSCDHRVIDGVKGAAFLTDLVGLLENPIRALY